MIYERLCNENLYQKLDKNLFRTIIKHKSIFADKKFKYLNKADYNRSNFHGLPNLLLMLLKNKILKSLVSTNRRT